MFRLIANGVEGDAVHGQGESVVESGGLVPADVARFTGDGRLGQDGLAHHGGSLQTLVEGRGASRHTTAPHEPPGRDTSAPGHARATASRRSAEAAAASAAVRRAAARRDGRTAGPGPRIDTTAAGVWARVAGVPDTAADRARDPDFRRCHEKGPDAAGPAGRPAVQGHKASGAYDKTEALEAHPI
jgi:hypothetical protein